MNKWATGLSMKLFVSIFLTISIHKSEANDYSLAVAANTVDTVISEIIVRRAYQELGHHVAIHRLPPKRALEEANAGIYDGDVQRIHSVENSYTSLIRLEPSINYINGTGFTHGSKGVDVKSWEDLEGQNVGIILGKNSLKIMSKKINNGCSITIWNLLRLSQRIE